MKGLTNWRRYARQGNWSGAVVAVKAGQESFEVLAVGMKTPSLIYYSHIRNIQVLWRYWLHYLVVELYFTWACYPDKGEKELRS